MAGFRLGWFRHPQARQLDWWRMEGVGIVVDVGKTHTYTGLDQPILRRCITILDFTGVLITYLWGRDCAVIGDHLQQEWASGRLPLLHVRNVSLAMIDQGKLGTVPGSHYMTSPAFPGGAPFPPALQQEADRLRSWFRAGGEERQRKARVAVRKVWCDATSSNPHRTMNYTADTVFDI